VHTRSRWQAAARHYGEGGQGGDKLPPIKMRNILNILIDIELLFSF
jgi:hypothetical protein